MIGSNRPGTLESIRSAHRNLAILRFLAAMPMFRSNELVLANLLDRIGLASSWDEVRGGLRGLDEMATVSLSIEGSLMVVELLRRGAEVATGRVSVDGVARPGPDCPY